LSAPVGEEPSGNRVGRVTERQHLGSPSSAGRSPMVGGPDAQRATGRWSAVRGVALQFVLVFLAAILYFAVRGFTQGSEADANRHGFDVLRFERALGIDWEEATQRFVLTRHELVTFANWVYMWGHWPVVAVTLFVLYRSRRDQYLLLRNAMFMSGAIGLVIFATYPVAPPRLLPTGTQFVDTVTTWSSSYRVLQPPGLVNKYAAIPSLHFGWNLLVGIALWRAFPSLPVRVLAITGPVLMAIAVVATANHYVLDAITGAVVALVGLAGSVALSRALARRRVASQEVSPATSNVVASLQATPDDR